MATPARIFGVLALLSLAGITSTMWHKYSAGSGRTAIASSQTNEAARNEPGANLQLDASLEALAPSSNLDAAFAGALQTSAVQSMINQLNDYSKQAALTKQVLTDPTTELGQLTYKKKMHRHRRVYQEYYDTNDNTDPYNDNDTNT